MQEERIFTDTGTLITLYPDACRVVILFGRDSKDFKEVIDQAKWVEKTLDEFHVLHKKNKFRVLVDFDKMTKPQLPIEARDIYLRAIKKSYVTKVALVADAINYSKLLPLLVVFRFGRRKIRFFISYPNASKWLGWK